MVREGQQIDVVDLTKTFGGLVAVDDLTFSVRPGVVTGFLGPNGSGKTTTLRCVLGLLRPTSGSTTIGGVPYRDLADPGGLVLLGYGLLLAGVGVLLSVRRDVS